MPILISKINDYVEKQRQLKEEADKVSSSITSQISSVLLLKSASTQLIANDALDLYLLISDNTVRVNPANGDIILDAPKNEDGTYFTFNQIEKVLELLDIMPIEKNHIDDCYLLECIGELSKSKIVSIEIQKKSTKLLNKLTRISTDYELDYSNIQAENKQYIKLFKKNKRNAGAFS